MKSDKPETFCIQMYTLALTKAQEEPLDQGLYRKHIEAEIKKSKIPYSDIKKIVSAPKSQWIQDLIQITRDVRLTLQTVSQYRTKLQNRALMHFTNGHKLNLSKFRTKTSYTNNIIAMYEKDPPTQWSQSGLTHFRDQILSNTVYLIGLTKANGVIVENQFILTCAHALVDQEQNLINFRCFVSGNGAYGIIKSSKQTLCTKTDVAMAKIIKILNFKDKNPSFSLTIPTGLKFKTQFSPIRCLQVGLLFNNESKDSFIKVFEPAQGFIERNLYEDQKDHQLIEDMGLLIHDCYGLWGTSGSPLWTADGELIGIHNAWNEDGYNISMIVHDDEGTEIRVVRQYERRAVSVHVLSDLFEKWVKQEPASLDILSSPNIECEKEQTIKRKVKLNRF